MVVVGPSLASSSDPAAVDGDADGDRDDAHQRRAIDRSTGAGTVDGALDGAGTVVVVAPAVALLLEVPEVLAERDPLLDDAGGVLTPDVAQVPGLEVVAGARRTRRRGS